MLSYINTQNTQGGGGLSVLHVLGSLNMCGAESRTMDVYRHIDRNICNFDFISMQPEKEYFESEIRSLGGKVFKIESPRKCGILKHIKQLRKCMNTGKYDAVHAHTSYHCGLVMLAAWLENIPVRIAHSRTTGTKNKSRFVKLFMAFGRSLIRCFSNVRIAISKEAGKFLFGHDKFEILPDAIDITKYQQMPPEKIPELRKSLNIPEKAFVIGQIGRFEIMKNHAFTLKWFANYYKKHPEAFLVLVGDGSLLYEMKELAEKLNISNSVLFTGVRNDVYDIIHAFNVMIFPSIYEGLGNVVHEAQAAGIPAVISDSVPSIADLGLGLVKRVSLNAPLDEWDKAIGQKYPAKTKEEINRAFTERKFTLEGEISRLMELYGVKK